MKKSHRFLYTIFILQFLFLSIFSTQIQISSAEDASLVKLQSQVLLYWSGEEVSDPVVPRDEIKTVNVTVEYSLKYGAYGFAEGIYENYKGKGAMAMVYLKILETSPGCHVVLRSEIVYLNISDQSFFDVPLYIVVDEDAPAFTQGYILIEAKTTGLHKSAPVQTDSRIVNLTFTPSYLPYINIDLPDVNTAQISPNEQAVFPIKITNLGNAKTTVILKVGNLPKGWKATVTDEVFLDEFETGSATLVIRPPRDFGYHDDAGVVSISLTPARTYNISEKGDPISLSFLVKSKGFFAEGKGLFQFVWILIILIIVIFIIRFIVKKGVIKKHLK